MGQRLLGALGLANAAVGFKDREDVSSGIALRYPSSGQDWPLLNRFDCTRGQLLKFAISPTTATLTACFQLLVRTPVNNS